jgi:hypothetical protein
MGNEYFLCPEYLITPGPANSSLQAHLFCYQCNLLHAVNDEKSSGNQQEKNDQKKPGFLHTYWMQ